MNDELKDIIQDGLINIDKAGDAGYEVGYDMLDDQNFYARFGGYSQEIFLNRQKAKIVATVTPYLEAQMGQKIKIYLLEMLFDDKTTVNIKYKTTNVPIYYGIISYNLEKNSCFEAETVTIIDDNTLLYPVVIGLYEYAYEGALNQFRQDFEKRFPQLIAGRIGSKDMDFHNFANPFIKVGFSAPIGAKYAEYEKEIRKIYQTYQTNKKITKEELQHLFDNVTGGYRISLQFHGVLKDFTEVPTKTLWTEIYQYIKDYDKVWMTNQFTEHIRITGEIQTSFRMMHLDDNYGKRTHPIVTINNNI